MWGRGLKLRHAGREHKAEVQSPPMWGRGLKLIWGHLDEIISRRPPCGGVD